MTKQEFEIWVERHCGELLAVARRRVREDAEDVVQDAVAGMLKSSELQYRDETTIWPWATFAIRQESYHARRSEARAERSLQDAGALLGEDSERTDGRYIGPVRHGAYPIAVSFCRCAGHLSWLRGEKVHEPGCSTTQILWIEAGYDRLPTSGRHVSYVYGVLACLNGNRAYINANEIAGLSPRLPVRASGFKDDELLADAKRPRRSRAAVVTAFERKTKIDFNTSTRPLPEGEGQRLVCDECNATNEALWSCEHATKKEVAA